DARSVTVLRGEPAEPPAAWSELIAAARAADVFVIGENHGHRLGLSVAAAIWDDVLDGAPDAALALEFFERDQQACIDDYLAGLTDEATFKRMARRNDNNYPAGHRAMLEYAKSADVPVIAANSPRVYVRAASREGFDRLLELTPEQRRLFRVPDELPAGRYREDFERVMTGNADAHGDGAASQPASTRPSLDGPFRAQSVWDWTMAESVSRALQAGRRPVLLVVGRFHSDFRGGLIQALERLTPGVRVLTLSFVNETSDVLREEDQHRADFVIYVGPSEPPERGS
ncbi:MAG: ChaN family lipoprotein, partial [Phycisphaerae bacterium]|nr:ChaN family lipoprotein [Phycisphaerae bacterium]